MQPALQPAPLPTPTLERLQSLVAADLQKVNALILEKAQNEVSLIPQLASHIIASGGKRLRPALTLACARLCGYAGARHVHLATCVEFIHTATLLHDDVVDESKLRRGSATANDLWGNKASVLVGDFLLSRAFQLMVGDGSFKTLKILSDASAIIAQGEVLQLTLANNLEIEESQYLEVITTKTAALFAAACELGAVVAEQEPWEQKLRDFGTYLGIAFQLVDDALDYSANQRLLGKSIGDDFREGKITLPVLLAFNRGSASEKQFWHKTLRDMDQTDGDLDKVLALLGKYHTIEETLARARGYCDKAREIMLSFPAGSERDALLETIDFCVSRAY